MFIFVALCLTVFVTAEDRRGDRTGDFVLTSDVYNFYFHPSHNLLLTVHAGNCYYADLDDSNILQTNVKDVENSIKTAIKNNDHVGASSLQAMREKYSDLLANFHCVGKNVHTLEFSASDSKEDNED